MRASLHASSSPDRTSRNTRSVDRPKLASDDGAGFGAFSAWNLGLSVGGRRGGLCPGSASAWCPRTNVQANVDPREAVEAWELEKLADKMVQFVPQLLEVNGDTLRKARLA